MIPTPAQRRADVVLAVVVLVGALISAVLSAIAGMYGDRQAAMPLSVAYFVAVTIQIPELYAGNVAMFIALYTVGAWSTNRRRATIVRIAIIAGMFLWLTIVMLIDATGPVPTETEEVFSRAGAFSPYIAYTLLTFLLNALYFGGAYYFGERSHQQMRERAALEERTAELEREREVTAAQAVALDRVRIARELHDVVAHHVSLMGVQAGAARSVMPKDPDHAREILEGVESSARQSLTELRQLLATLRTPDGSDPEPDTAPTTRDLDAVSDLVEATRSAGMPTTFHIVGEEREVPGLVQVNLYRIAQEALTNARRHGGPHATAEVRLRYTDESVELEVSNTGRVGSGAPGLGQLGMRERAGASGGTIEIGPRSRGGYLVRTRVPLTTKASARV